MGMFMPVKANTFVMSISVVFFSLFFATSNAYNFGPPMRYNSTQLSSAVLYTCSSIVAQRTSSIIFSAEVESNQARHYFNDFTEHILKAVDDLKIQLELWGHHHAKSWDFFNILLVDSADSFRKINPGEKTKDKDFSEYYLVVLKPFKVGDYMHDIEAIFAYCWSYYIVNVCIVLDDGSGSIQMYTYFPFTEEQCFSTTPVRLNGGMEFRSIFPDKMLNFHNCQLVGALWNVPPYLILNENSTGLQKYAGIEGHLLRELSKKMNFSLAYVTPPNDEQRGLVFTNGTVTGAIKMLQEKKAHLSLGSFRSTVDRSTVLSPSRSFYQTMQVYTVKARTVPWTTFGILMYPFDYYIWTFVLVFVTSTIGCLLVLEKYNPKALYFIFGFRDARYGINIIGAWLGSPVVPAPKRNFARYHMCLWLLVTLIVRNAYQGLLFDLLRSNMAKLPPDTAEQLVQRQYTLIVNLASFDTFAALGIIRDGLLNISTMNMTDAGGYPILEATNDNYATATPKDFLSYYVMTTKKYDVFHVLTDGIFSQQLCIYFTKHSFLTDRFDAVLMQLRSFGVIEKWASQYIDDSFIEMRRSRPSAGVPITFDQVEGIFQICAFFLLASTVVFVGEVISLKIGFLRRIFQ